MTGSHSSAANFYDLNYQQHTPHTIVSDADHICLFRASSVMSFQVLLLDIDTMIVQNIDELFEKDKVVLYTEDLPMDPHHHNAKPPMQGGFFLVKPGPESDKVYDDIVKIMEDGNFNAGSGWNNSRIGYHWGGAAVQGVYVVPTRCCIVPL